MSASHLSDAARRLFTLYRKSSPVHEASAIRCGETADILSHIHKPGVELAIWERSLPDDFDRWLENLDPDLLPDGRLLLPANEVTRGIIRLFEDAGTPEGAMRDFLQQDIETLAHLFMKIMRSDVLDIRLETVRTDACWKFHRDHVPARLLCSYRGLGTEWVIPEASSAAIAAQKEYTGPRQQLPRHAAGLFKGCCADSGNGIVHRSPAIADSGEVRLLLCLNLPSASSPALWKGARSD
tara:strand:+ start:13022 stop:13738 length:717 start_codon:yes stop_codon:yes gene_type:complete